LRIEVGPGAAPFFGRIGIPTSRTKVDLGNLLCDRVPETHHVFVVGGQSDYDRALMAETKTALNSYENKLDVTYLTDLS
jgi:hypothetical protein